ncbi:MAG: metalloregulator ArsR/SmtB family transcription factor [Burkholderiales bacterium]|jgi:DNA-binding transcriptional ArsR family regulator|nr:metalloregulator ArsR/SmtB family transcription factor [Burkholderiales bacterium]
MTFISSSQIDECPLTVKEGSDGKKRPDPSSPEMIQLFDAVARYFSLLSDPTRMKILHFSCRGKRSVSDIVDATKATQTNISRHLALLYQAGLVGREREGKRVLYWTRDPDLIKTICHSCAQMIHKIKSEGALQEEWLKEIQTQPEDIRRQPEIKRIPAEEIRLSA